MTTRVNAFDLTNVWPKKGGLPNYVSLAQFGKRGNTTLNNFGLTDREAQVMDLVCQGKSNKEIGALLEMKTSTVKNHVNSILRKMNLPLHFVFRGEVLPCDVKRIVAIHAWERQRLFGNWKG